MNFTKHNKIVPTEQRFDLLVCIFIDSIFCSVYIFFYFVHICKPQHVMRDWYECVCGLNLDQIKEIVWLSPKWWVLQISLFTF